MREVQEIAVVTANLINVYMDARVTDMLVFSKTCGSLREALTSDEARVEATHALEGCLKLSGAYEAILLIDNSSVCVASAPAGLVGKDVSSEKAFDGAAKGRLTVSDACKSDLVASLDPKPSGWAAEIAGWTVEIAVPITGRNNSQGVLMAYLKWTRLVELIAKVRVGETGYVFVLDRENKVIIHPTPSLYGTGLRDAKINLPGLDDAVKKKADNHRYQFRNFMTERTNTKFAGFAYPKEYGNFRGLGWTVGAGADEHEICEKRSFWFKLLR